MDTKRHINILSLFLSVILLFMSSAISSAGEYDSLKGVKEVKAVFDFRIADPMSAAVHLDLMLKTFNDANLTINSKKPDFAVIFMGPAVKLVSKNRAGFTSEQQKYLDAIAKTISDMAKDGFKLEICLAAVNFAGIDPASIYPELKQIPNGWISLIGYQLHGYTLVDNF
jgi:intracellular sulfur oxidation DsrE/DsrF family protein